MEVVEECNVGEFIARLNNLGADGMWGGLFYFLFHTPSMGRGWEEKHLLEFGVDWNMIRTRDGRIKKSAVPS